MRIWSAFSSPSICFTFSTPPVIFRCVRRFPAVSLEILKTRAPKSPPYSGVFVNWSRIFRNSVTPSILSAEPKQHGKTFRSAIIVRIWSSSTLPVSRYCSSTSSSHMASSSSNSEFWRSCEKFRQCSERRLCSSSSSFSASVPG